MFQKISAAVFVLFVLSISACAQQKNENNITVKQLKEEIKNDSSLVILDVRTPQELTGDLGKIDGVINIPVQELEKRVNELNDYKDKNIAVICRTGRRSAIAAEFLTEHGFKVKNVLGGMSAYRQDGK